MARKKNSAWKDGKQKFSKYVSPSPFYITAGDSHNFCVVCLGSMHSQHPSGLATCIVSVCLWDCSVAPALLFSLKRKARFVFPVIWGRSDHGGHKWSWRSSYALLFLSSHQPTQKPPKQFLLIWTKARCCVFLALELDVASQGNSRKCYSSTLLMRNYWRFCRETRVESWLTSWKAVVSS